MTSSERIKLQSIVKRRWRVENGFITEGQRVIMECPEEDARPLVDRHNAIIDQLQKLLDEAI